MFMKKNGFTLVELLVMLVVLSILTAIAIPNISGILSDNRNSVMLDYAARMLDDAKIKVSMDKTIKPTSFGYCSVIRLNALDKNNSFNKGPYGGEFDRAESFVLIKLDSTPTSGGKKTYKYKYYVRIVEKKDSKVYGLNFAESEKVDSKKKELYNNNVTLLNIGLSNAVTETAINGLRSGTCSSIYKDLT